MIKGLTAIGFFQGAQSLLIKKRQLGAQKCNFFWGVAIA